MSAGQSARRGYAYTVAKTELAHRSHRSEELVSIMAAATVIFVAVAALTDPIIATTLGHAVGTAWSSAVALFAHR
jgi:hypothetical protein